MIFLQFVQLRISHSAKVSIGPFIASIFLYSVTATQLKVHSSDPCRLIYAYSKMIFLQFVQLRISHSAKASIGPFIESIFLYSFTATQLKVHSSNPCSCLIP